MRQPTIVQLRASPFFGGPERQMLELARESRDLFRWVFVSFQEEGRYQDFLDRTERAGFETHVLQHDWPRLLATYHELLALLKRLKPNLVCAHGYKSNLLGLLAARRLGIPIVSVSHGWTAETLAVRAYEVMDRRLLPRMDGVICVSQGQARKVLRTGVPEWKVQVIHNAVRLERFSQPDQAYREQLESMFADRPSVIIGAAGRFSAEKGFSFLIDAAAQVLRMKDEGGRMKDEGGRMKDEGGRMKDEGGRMKDESLPPSPLANGRGAGGEGNSPLANGRGAGGEGLPPSAFPSIGFVLFGDGRLRAALEAHVKARGLTGRFCIGGFRPDLDKFYPHLDLVVLPSLTEGLSNVVLEAFAAGVPVVATDVGGTGELIDDGVNGYLVPPGDPAALAAGIREMLKDPARRRAMGCRGRVKVQGHFSYPAQARAYQQFFARFVPAPLPSDRRSEPTVLHLTASPSFGGPERQMLELGCQLRGACRSVYASFREEGRCGAFINNARREGFEAYALKYDTPRLWASFREVLSLARSIKPAVLCPHGYKSNLIGLLVARRLGIPIFSVSHGWTAESLLVRLYEALDRRVLRLMDKVVCVSEGQARKVRRAGVREGKIQVIRDAVRAERFAEVDGTYRDQLERMFPVRPDVIVGAAGRLSPEKGFKNLVDAAAQVLRMKDEGGRMKDESLPPSPLSNGRGAGGEGNSPLSNGRGAGGEGPSVGFILFGDGPLRTALARRIAASGLQDHFLLAGFRSDLDKFYPHLDLLVLPSYTEGLPNVVLEAFAAGVPVVATAVGGTPEAVEDGVNGYLVPPGDATALAGRISDMLANPARRREMGARGRENVRQVFSFAQQAREYLQLFESLRSACGTMSRPVQPAVAETGPEK